MTGEKEDRAMMKRLAENTMEKVIGGMIVYAQGLPEFDPSCPWEVVDNNTCAVLGKFPTECGACKYADTFGGNSYDGMEVDTQTVLRLRANPQV